MDKDDIVLMCADCHVMKMGHKSLRDKMNHCDGCGMPMREMRMM